MSSVQCLGPEHRCNLMLHYSHRHRAALWESSVIILVVGCCTGPCHHPSRQAPNLPALTHALVVANLNPQDSPLMLCTPATSLVLGPAPSSFISKKVLGSTLSFP